LSHAPLDSSIGALLLSEGTAAARRQGCRAYARALEAYKQLQAEGALTADSRAGLQASEAGAAECRMRSR
jgi:hypothetical protein